MKSTIIIHLLYSSHQATTSVIAPEGVSSIVPESIPNSSTIPTATTTQPALPSTTSSVVVGNSTTSIRLPILEVIQWQRPDLTLVGTVEGLKVS